MPDEQDRFAGAIGRCSPGVRFRIADNEGNELPVGESGRTADQNRFHHDGYLEPDLTRAALQTISSAPAISRVCAATG